MSSSFLFSTVPELPEMFLGERTASPAFGQQRQAAREILRGPGRVRITLPCKPSADARVAGVRPEFDGAVQVRERFLYIIEIQFDEAPLMACTEGSLGGRG